WSRWCWPGWSSAARRAQPAQVLRRDAEVRRDVLPAHPRIERGLLATPGGVAVRGRQDQHLVLAPRLADVERLDEAADPGRELRETRAQRLEVLEAPGQGRRRLERLDPGHRRRAREQVEERSGDVALAEESPRVFLPGVVDVELAHQPARHEEAVLGAIARPQ